MKARRHIYLRLAEDGVPFERRFCVDPPGDQWIRLTKEQWDTVRDDWTGYRWDRDEMTYKALPKVLLNVSTTSVSRGDEFSVRVDPVDIDPADDKTIATVWIDNVSYDLEIGDDMILIEATEVGVYNIMLDDPDVRCVNAPTQVVMVLEDSE